MFSFQLWSARRSRLIGLISLGPMFCLLLQHPPYWHLFKVRSNSVIFFSRSLLPRFFFFHFHIFCVLAGLLQMHQELCHVRNQNDTQQESLDVILIKLGERPVGMRLPERALTPSNTASKIFPLKSMEEVDSLDERLNCNPQEKQDLVIRINQEFFFLSKWRICLESIVFSMWFVKVG